MSDFKDFLKEIGPKWQDIWAKSKVFESEPDSDKKKPKYFLTFPYPYVNGSVHVGHGYSNMKLDFVARIKRMQGYNVLFPQGFHATGEPIVGMAKRLKEGDEIQKKVLKAFGVKDKDFSKFHDPKHIVSHFVKLMKKDMQSVGLSIDWRRQFITTPITPVYSKFIEWQYLTLKKLGYVKLGSHPVIWCPKDLSPTGDHDRLEGDGVSIAEYVLLKFPYEDAFFLPATLRAETIYGVTNMYLNPKSSYVTAEVDGEKWIVSKETIIKLQDQEHDVKVISENSPKEFFGKFCKNPITDNNVIILPATFVDSSWGTGVVMSVPAHAPVDWVAIQNIKEQVDTLEKEYGINKQSVLDIEPISLISVDGYGEFPAVEIIEKMGITDQNDPKVEKATKQIYKAEFHTGICKEITGQYSGKTVYEIKDSIIADFIQNNTATKLYEPADKVVCRCGTRNHVKVLSEQWFLTYSDPKWKKATHDEIDNMKFYPESIKSSFDYTVDWLGDKACARRSGLGTPMPWDPDWIIETLSDSTIYMAYYIISKYVNQGKIKVENATIELFDFIFRNKGKIESVSKKTGLSNSLLKEVKSEFNYWYPMDLRGSAKDLVHNHLTFCIFQHQALFPKAKRPLRMSVNGYMQFKGQKMSKSKGILTPLSEAVNEYSADLTRIGLIGAGEGLDDANFNEEELSTYLRWLDQFNHFYGEKQTRKKDFPIDLWLKSKMQHHIQDLTEFAENIMTRSYVQNVLFGIMNDLRYYRKRTDSIGPGFTYATKKLILLLTPIIPHLCEELWSKNHENTIMFEEFPKPEQELNNDEIEASENYILAIIDDINNIQKAMKTDKINNVEISITPEWKSIILEEFQSDPTKLIPRIMKNPDIKKQGKAAAAFAQKLMKKRDIPEVMLSRNQEFTVLNDARTYIESVIDSKVKIVYAEESDSPKKKFAEPMRPGMYVE